jgi:hypothetical protein
MKRLELWRAKLKAAQAEKRIVERQFNASSRALARLLDEIHLLEKKIEGNMAKSKSKD